MSRNGSGGYSLPVNTWNPATTGVSATVTDWQALINDIATAMQQSVSSDGQTAMTGNLAMGNNKLTGLSAGTATGHSLRWEQLFSQGTIANLASATTTDIGAQNTSFLNITGTTTITGFGTNYNGPRYLVFAGILTLTHSATLVCPGAANITTAAGDAAIFIPISGGWQIVAYQKASGLPVSIAGLSPRATRIDVATVAGTVNLTSSAPDSDDIRLTGALAVTAFTVAVGRVIRFVCSGASSMANNANIVTNTGALVQFAAGDSGMLRATAENVVELIDVSYVNPDGASLKPLTVTGAKITAATITPDKLSGAQSGSAPALAVRGWCLFNGTTVGTNAPIAGSNVTSVTRSSAGIWVVNLTTAMPNANFGVVASQTNVSNAITGGAPVTTTTAAVTVFQPGGAGAIDATPISVFILG